MKPRQLTSTWTVELEQGDVEFGETVLADISKSMQETIDWWAMCDALTLIGWTKVVLDSMTVEKSDAIDRWISTQLNGDFKTMGLVWLFEKQKDATFFALRWA